MRRGRPGRPIAVSGFPGLFRACSLLAATGAAAFPTSAFAQVALSVAADSDYRFRGASLSGERPTAAAQVAYDHPSGLYFYASGTGVKRRGHLALLNVQGNVGYARRLSSSVSVDAGLVHSRYQWGNLPNPSSNRTEAYVGVNVSHFAARLSYSPHYFEKGLAMIYGEVEAGFQPARNWRLSARAGRLTLLRAPGAADGTSRYDWRLSVSRQWGAFEIYSALSGGGPDRGTHGATAVTAGASLNF